MQQTSGSIRTIAANFTRPNDTNAYAAGDVVCNSTATPVIMTFSRSTVDIGSGAVLQSATIVSSANQATKPDLQLWLFDTTVVMDNDNAPFTPTDAEMLTLLHIISFPASAWVAGDATSGAGGNAVCNAQGLWLPVNTVVGKNALFGILVASATYTPVAQESFAVRLGFMD